MRMTVVLRIDASDTESDVEKCQIESLIKKYL